MGLKNYLIEGGSGTGKTSVANALVELGFQVVHGDRELAYRGDPQTGETVCEPIHDSDWDEAVWRQNHHCWDVERVTELALDETAPVTFFCGGSRNSHQFIHLFAGVFVLKVSCIETILRRIEARVARDPTDFGAKVAERELIVQLHGSGRDVPANGISIDASVPLDRVVEHILAIVFGRTDGR